MKIINVWWGGKLYDYYCGGDKEVEWNGVGDLKELWSRISKEVGLDCSLDDFWVEDKGEGWVIWKLEDDSSEGGWLILEVEKGKSVDVCIKEYGDKIWG